MSLQLGTFGAWFNPSYDDNTRARFVAEAEVLGFGTAWLGLGRRMLTNLTLVERALDATKIVLAAPTAGRRLVAPTPWPTLPPSADRAGRHGRPRRTEHDILRALFTRPMKRAAANSRRYAYLLRGRHLPGR